MHPKWKQKKNSIFHPAVLLLMVFTTSLNILLSMLMRATGLPVYMDTAGTIIASALGGAVPGLLCAFATNMVNFFLDGSSIFFVSLNMLIAIVANAFFGEFSTYRKQRKAAKKKKEWTPDSQKWLVDITLLILVLALIGGGIGGMISWYLYETPSEVPVVVRISRWLNVHWGLGVRSCHMVSAFLMDVADKAVSVALALLIISLVPKKAREWVRMSPWRQKPILMEEQKGYNKKRRIRMPISVRINLILILSTFLITLVALIFSAISFRKNTLDSLSECAKQASYLAACEIDPVRVDAYLEQGNTAMGYTKVRQRLENLKNSSSNISFLYVYKIEEDGCRVVFDLPSTLSDGTFVEAYETGTKVAFEEEYLPYKEDLLAGKMIPTVRLDDRFGSFISSYYPVYDKNGDCVCYAVANVEYRLIILILKRYYGRVLLLLTGFLLLIGAISVLTTKYRIVMPIMSMTVYADELIRSRGGADEANLEKIEELDIRTGDEIEQLYRAFCKMTGDTVYQLNENQNKSEEISKMQNALIITMADMVESRDSDTGAHVLKTSEYVRIILQGLKKNGYYAEKISDKYMRDVEMSAPLHDVGKINIPDAILNKPGKLTKEEFEIMKTHTTAGRSILENAISSMEGENYLKEARNMAAYHHERWDGKGYPEGLHGEVIPLSARVMAVADVFDALSSPRVYKPAFSFEEAVRMIQEGSGTQFDPKCVEVFTESLTEVKKVLKRYQEI